MEHDTPFILPKFDHKLVNNVKRKENHLYIHYVWSTFPNFAKTKYSIENDMNFDMSFIKKFRDVDQ